MHTATSMDGTPTACTHAHERPNIHHQCTALCCSALEEHADSTLIMAQCQPCMHQQMYSPSYCTTKVLLHSFCICHFAQTREAIQNAAAVHPPLGLIPALCACVQIQMRDIPGYVETRQQLLQLKSNAKGHWLGFAIAHHLNGNHALAVQILEAFEQTQEGVPDNEQYEQSEMVMYKAMILREGGELEHALDLLQTHKVIVLLACLLQTDLAFSSCSASMGRLLLCVLPAYQRMKVQNQCTRPLFNSSGGVPLEWPASSCKQANSCQQLWDCPGVNSIGVQGCT